LRGIGVLEGFGDELKDWETLERAVDSTKSEETGKINRQLEMERPSK